ncbi:hypothetical protein D0817_24790 [Flavobacterium cupreum]|uniref:Uncharacterized protein n=2 Tax=Flavobacterium TaxID=237 RepID=A0A434A026_9FLAO|nr:hypothetical protein [Flavobacterium cupreum]RUT67723.1 hypothetical protein D0817_24790 [Flavobacterium cupreum]
MNKEVVIIGGGVLGGMVSNGATTLLPASESPIMNMGLAAVSIFGVTKVTGTTTKSNLIKGALIGSAIVQVLLAVKKVSAKTFPTALSGTSKFAQFAQGAVGLGCPDQSGLHGQFVGADGQIYQYDEPGLNGQFVGADGQIYQYDEGGLNGQFMDEAGNVFELADDGLHGAEEALYLEDGLHGAEQIYGEESGLNAPETEIYNELYQQ